MCSCRFTKGGLKKKKCKIKKEKIKNLKELKREKNKEIIAKNNEKFKSELAEEIKAFEARKKFLEEKNYAPIIYAVIKPLIKQEGGRDAFATKFGVDVSTVSRLKHGVSMEMFMRIKSAYGLSFDELLGISNSVHVITVEEPDSAENLVSYVHSNLVYNLWVCKKVCMRINTSELPILTYMYLDIFDVTEDEEIQKFNKIRHKRHLATYSQIVYIAEKLHISVEALMMKKLSEKELIDGLKNI